jgi:hypothetical protein
MVPHDAAGRPRSAMTIRSSCAAGLQAILLHLREPRFAIATSMIRELEFWIIASAHHLCQLSPTSINARAERHATSHNLDRWIWTSVLSQPVAAAHRRA